MIHLKSVHQLNGENGGPRYLIDWVWPAHKHHRALSLSGWPRELLPDAALWDWFHHDPLTRRTAFQKRYFRQLEKNEESWLPLASALLKGDITLLYNPKKAGFTPAQFLKEFLEIRFKTRKPPKPPRSKRVHLAGQGVAPPVEKAISRKHDLPLKPEIHFETKEKQRFVPAEKRKRL